MKGVILAPILAAFIAAGVTGSSTVAAVVFFVVLALAGLAIVGDYQRRTRKSAPAREGQGRNNNHH